MLLKKIVLIVLFIFSQNAFAGLIELNKNKYFEIDFTIKSDKGILDTDINRFDLWYSFANFGFTEKVELFNGDQLLSQTINPIWYSNDFSPSGIDFSSFRNGSIDGTIRISAWDSSDATKNILLNDSFGWVLSKCDTNGDCPFAVNSYVNFGERRVVNNPVSVPEPSTIILFISAFLFMSKRKYSK
jgi:hypothetical protein